MVRTHWPGKHARTLLLVTLGAVIGSLYLLESTRFGLQRAILLASPILVVWGILLLQFSLIKLGRLETKIIISIFLGAVLLFSGFIPYVLGQKDHTGIFLDEDDYLYEARIVSEEDSKLLKTLDPNAHFYSAQPYIRETVVSQTLTRNPRPNSVFTPVGRIRSTNQHYYVLSSTRGGKAHYKSIKPHEILIIDTGELRVWEWDPKNPPIWWGWIWGAYYQ